MSEVSSSTIPCIYEEVPNEETSLDLSSRGLEVVSKIHNHMLSMLYLQNNHISTLPEDFFPSLPCLMWLDMRDNKLTDIPKTIFGHPSLTHLLLQNNNLTSLPSELGTVMNLKVLQLNGNPLMYPPREIISAGTSKILTFLHDKHVDFLTQSQSDLSEDKEEGEDTPSTSGAFQESIFGQIRSYNSVIDQDRLVKTKTLSVKFNDKDEFETEEYYPKFNGKCRRLAESRTSFPPKTQSAKYLKPLLARSKSEQEAKMRRSFMKDLAVKKHKELLATRDKILQDRKNAEHLRQWRRNYRDCKHLARDYKMGPANFPYDTHPDYMTVLTREDIEKDLPDKYKKKLTRRAKPTVPRKSSSDIHLAMRIKKLFENLESLDLKGENMTPRTEQKVLLNEIQKISEIKQKLMELSVANGRSVDTSTD